MRLREGKGQAQAARLLPSRHVCSLLPPMRGLGLWGSEICPHWNSVSYLALGLLYKAPWGVESRWRRGSWGRGQKAAGDSWKG